MKNVKVTIAILTFMMSVIGTFAFKKYPRTLFKYIIPNQCIAIQCHEDPTDVNPNTGLPEKCDVNLNLIYRYKIADTICASPVNDAYKAFN